MNIKSVLTGIAIILVIWLIAAPLIHQAVVPGPGPVAAELVKEVRSGTVFLHTLVSLYRIAVALLLALISAVPLGILAGRNRAAHRILSPLSYLLYPVPKIAFLPVLMVLFGLGNLPKILLVAIILFFPVFIAVRDGVLDLPKEYDYLAIVFELSKKRILLDIILPGILPRILSSVRISIGISLAVLFFSENFATSYGIGHYIMNSWIMVNYPRMYVGIIFLSITGLTLYLLLDQLEHKIVPWSGKK
ncbi:MAG: ABC transporter permease [Spirochaetales bacterium]|nr:ABC transporter permease [Spirochaetales bacterium]